jgi:hypothetical protein
MKRVFIFLFVAFASITSVSYAQVETAVPFLKIQPDARASGMGNTGVALANNAAAIFWNPAGLGFQKGNQVNITHAKWLPNLDAGLFYDYLVGRHDVKGIGTFGADFTYFNGGHQIHTDINENQYGKFSSYAFAVGISYGIKLSDNWAVGTGIRFIHSKLFSGAILDGSQRMISPISTFGVDLAALYKTDPFKSFGNNKAAFHVGIDISNMGPGVRYSKATKNNHKINPDSAKNSDPLPTILRVGWAFKTSLGKNNSITLANDYSKIMARRGDNSLQALADSWSPFTRQNSQGKFTLSTFQQFRIGAGLEYWYKHLFSVRSGYYYEDPHNGNRSYVTIGAGIRYHSIGVDVSHIFSLRQYGPLANMTRFGLLVNF